MERKSGLRLAMKSQVVEVGPTMDQVRNEIYNMENLRHVSSLHLSTALD